MASPDFNVRCHVIPGRWLTFFVLNAGGEAFDWFHCALYPEIDDDQFYGDYLPGVLDRFLDDQDSDGREAELPTYVPFLAGSRYAVERAKGSFEGLTLETTREDLLLSVIRGNMQYLGEHLRQVGRLVALSRRVGISGGGADIRGMLTARRRWTGDFEYVFQDQSSMLGAAMLGQTYQAGETPEQRLAGATSAILGKSH